jgi:hypothetical protein
MRHCAEKATEGRAIKDAIHRTFQDQGYSNCKSEQVTEVSCVDYIHTTLLKYGERNAIHRQSGILVKHAWSFYPEIFQKPLPTNPPWGCWHPSSPSVIRWSLPAAADIELLENAEKPFVSMQHPGARTCHRINTAFNTGPRAASPV